MKIFKKIISISLMALIAAIGFASVLPIPVFATNADSYWVGGSGNWSDAANHWAATSNGAPGAGNYPGITTNVHFDLHSFSGAGQKVTMNGVDGNIYFKDMDWTGATNTPEMAASTGVMSIYGSLTYITDMVTNYTMDYYFYATTSGNTVNFAGHKLDKANNDIEFSGTGGEWTLHSDVDLTGGYGHFYLQEGTLNTNNYNIIGAKYFGMPYGTTKVLNMGSSTITIIQTGWDYSGTNLTLSANTGTINITAGYFHGGGITTYNIVNLAGATSTITGNNTFNTLGLTRVGTQAITATGTTQTVTNMTRNAGTQVKTLVDGTYTKAGGGTISLDYLSISGSTATPANTWYAGTHSTNGGGNFGWIFTDPPVPSVTSVFARDIMGLMLMLVGILFAITTATTSDLSPIVVVIVIAFIFIAGVAFLSAF